MFTQDQFVQPCAHAGKLEYVQYDSRAYALEEIYQKVRIPMTKGMWVYTPYDYDAAGSYNVLVLMHGGTDNEGFWFGEGRYDKADKEFYPDYGNITKNMIDRLIDERQIDPLIVVAPSFEEEVEPYRSNDNHGNDYFAVSSYFWKELRGEILPYIVTHYATYAKSAQVEDICEARHHFAYAGASQGSITGLYSVACHCLDEFSYLGCMSAGAVRMSLDNGNLSVALDEDKLTAICTALSTDNIDMWYNACGDADMMYAVHRATYEKALDRLPGQLKDGVNCCFVTHPGAKHSYKCWSEDLCNMLLEFFQ